MTSGTTSATGDGAAPATGPALPAGLAPPPLPPTQDDKKPGTNGDGDKPPKEKKDLLPELCAGVYADVFDAAAWYVLKDDPIELPSKRAKARGEQLAFALRELGWEDTKILLLVGLSSGIVGDAAFLIREKKKREALASGGNADKPAKRPKPAPEVAVEVE